MVGSDRPGDRRGQADPHGWNSLDRYITIHEKHLRDLEHFVVGGRVNWNFDGKRQEYVGTGRLICDHGLYLKVRKVLEVRDDGLVRTHRYSYHASHTAIPAIVAELRGSDVIVEAAMDDPDTTEGCGIFRYDCSPHFMDLPGHLDAHHKHIYVVDDWVHQEPVEWIGRDRWPHLSDAIVELEKWWADHSETCALPRGRS